MKALLLDDEPYCVELLGHLLKRHCPEIEITASFTDPIAALEYLRKHPSPNLVFLDVEMPRLNAFDLLNLLHPFTFKLIFTTAYDKYAVKAIKFSALDYLLKPIDIEELKSAVKKANSQQLVQASQLDMAAKYRNSENKAPDRIALCTAAGVDFVQLKEILYCSSDGSYTEVHLHTGNKIVLSKSLKELEELLPPSDFFRPHHSHLLNLQHIKRYIKGSGGEILMANGKRLPVARSRKLELLEKLGLNS
ncbi:LytR/AlgR family response regulator transcription factor [Haliscomenobacter sp.]|uniref:LytR/AlgR family response regulator transcription factor n=1 Tax=Haliscomenobacter sp. TaxID=2717303 RepID=UPI00359307AE